MNVSRSKRFADLPRLSAHEVGRPKFRLRNPMAGGVGDFVVQPIYDYYGTAVATAVVRQQLFSIPVGGNYLTSDIATGLRTPVTEAEKIKIRYGCAYMPLIQKDEMIEVPSVGGREAREVSRQILGRIIEPRMEEILNLAYKEIVRSGYEELLAAGIVITGGTSITEGVIELAEQLFNLPVRRGYPMGIGGLTDVVNSPVYATGVGLIIHGSRHLTKDDVRRGGELSVFGGLIRRIKKWFLEFF